MASTGPARKRETMWVWKLGNPKCRWEIPCPQENHCFFWYPGIHRLALLHHLSDHVGIMGSHTWNPALATTLSCASAIRLARAALGFSSQLPARWSLDLSPTFLGGWAPTTGTSGVLCGLQRNQFTGGTYSDSRPPRVLQGFWVAPTGRCRTTTAVHQDHQSCWPILKTGSLVPFDHFSSIAWKDVESLEFYIFGGPHWLTNLDGNSIQLTGLHWDAHQVNPCWDWAIERTRIG